MKRGNHGLSEAEHARRRQIADDVILEGGNQVEFARRAGLEHINAHQWLRRHEPDRKRQLAGRRGRPVELREALIRLLLLKSVEAEGDGVKRIAKVLGVSPAGLYAFVTRWAPDGLDAAIADLMPDDEDAADA